MFKPLNLDEFYQLNLSMTGIIHSENPYLQYVLHHGDTQIVHKGFKEPFMLFLGSHYESRTGVINLFFSTDRMLQYINCHIYGVNKADIICYDRVGSTLYTMENHQ